MRTLSTQSLAVLAVVLLVATAGCIADPIGAGTDPTDDATDTATTERTTDDRHSQTGSESGPGETTERNDLEIRDVDPDDAPDLAASLNDPVACDGGWVSYWGTGNAQMLWSEDGELRVGWTVPGNQSTLFVAFENDTAVGYDHVEYDQSITADGSAVPVDETADAGRYAVVAMLDVNGNGEYDPDVDRPCRSDGDHEISTSGWIWVDWDADDR